MRGRRWTMAMEGGGSQRRGDGRSDLERIQDRTVPDQEASDPGHCRDKRSPWR